MTSNVNHPIPARPRCIDGPAASRYELPSRSDSAMRKPTTAAAPKQMRTTKNARAIAASVLGPERAALSVIAAGMK